MPRNHARNRKVLLGAALFFALIVAPGLLFGVNNAVRSQFDEGDALIDRATRDNQLRMQLHAFVYLAQSVESGSRGYVITGDREFLKPYEYARPRVEGALEKLAEYVPENPWLAPHIALLREASARRLASADRNVELTRNGQRATAEALIGKGDGQRAMEALVERANEIDHEAAELMRRSAALSQEARRDARITATILQSTLVMLILTATLLALKNLRSRDETLERLEHSDVRQQAIFNNARDGMIIFDKTGSIDTLNPAAAALFGYRIRDLPRRNVDQLFEIAPEPGRIASFLSQLAAGAEVRGRFEEYSGRRQDGRVFPVEVVISPVPLPGDTVYLAVIRDISDRKRQENMKSEFLSTVSHELRTPLTSIAGSLGLLNSGVRDQLPDVAKRLIAIAQDNSERMARMINDILDIGKIESGKLDLAIALLPLEPLLREALDAHRGFAEARDVSLQLGAVPENAVIVADRDRVAQILSNLLSNAIKFSPAKGVVRVEAAGAGDATRISIFDSGPGVPEEFADRIFSAAPDRDAAASRQTGGTGLGVAIVREIAEHMGGAITFENLPGSGAVFHIDLPAERRAQARARNKVA